MKTQPNTIIRLTPITKPLYGKYIISKDIFYNPKRITLTLKNKTK